MDDFDAFAFALAFVEKNNAADESFGDENYFIIAEPLSSLFESAEVVLEGAIGVVPSKDVVVIHTLLWMFGLLVLFLIWATLFTVFYLFFFLKREILDDIIFF